MSVGGPVMAPNTSGQGSSAVVPEEIKGWNWGAFFLNWVWSIGMNTWIGLLSLVLGIIMAVVLGVKGNEWAWQNRKWESVEDFKACQGIWTKWGVVIFVLQFVFAFLVLIPIFMAARNAALNGTM